MLTAKFFTSDVMLFYISVACISNLFAGGMPWTFIDFIKPFILDTTN